ncbi:arginine deiminase family protein [Candidatus Neptunochlamydia vexilliferae]|uniref:arginine deiminase family protein n=1 Tax=Candidatus Neptunichlamydia vexilliferae TaxID=1651774 RepID=UPI001890BD94|nr:arginine deiminase family protein [Candidatus Neptunochlamydia vexilliferae]
MDGKIRAEWDPLKKVVVHRPGIEMFFGLLDPYGSLYERAFSRDGARFEHDMLTRILDKEYNVEVLHLKDLIIKAATKDPSIKEKLLDKARESFEYVGDQAYIERAKKRFDEHYQYYDILHFFYVILMHPRVKVKESPGSRNVDLEVISRQPLANLYFMRDQQFMTDQGVVLCRMAKPSRRRETEVTKFLWEEVLNIPILHEMKDPATIEGGEFIPMGTFALIGVGDRTNQEAIDQLLSLPLGYEQIGVVHQPLHPLIPSSKPDPMINMHLDTYFNVAGKDVVVGAELLLKEAKVDIYHNEGEGKFRKDPKQTTLYQYVIEKGFQVINITTLEQMSYASNFLCIKDKEILAVDVEPVTREVLRNLRHVADQNPEKYGALLKQAEQDYEYLKREGQFFPHKREIYQHGVSARALSLKHLTGGYGAAHCMTCALSRS